MQEIVLYVPAGTRKSTNRIPRGAAIVGKPSFGAAEVEVYFEGPDRPSRGWWTFADRAFSATGRLLEGAAFGGCLIVSPAALLVVGVVNFAEGRVSLTGPQSIRAVARWLGAAQLDPAQLHESGQPPDGQEVMSIETPPLRTATLEPALLYALLDRGGVKADGEEWLAPDGRRTGVLGDALMWALERIAREG